MLFSEIINFIKVNRNNGRRKTFMLDDEGLDLYIQWAFQRNNIILSYSDSSISGICVAYVLPKPCDFIVRNMLPYEEEILPKEESDKEICIMDWIALNSQARKDLIEKFFFRFPNWENQTKWGIHFGVVKQFNNKYMKTLKGLN
jgi:hypothetical protein